MRFLRPFLIASLAACVATGIAPASAATVIDLWSAVHPPPAPELKDAELDPKSTALLLLDFNGHETAASGPCNAATKPRCLASVPKVKALLDRARERGMLVVYSLSGNGVVGDIRPELAPRPTDPVVKSGPDKFIGTDLRDILRGKGIGTVVVTGTAAEGAVLNTASDAALNGMTVVVPVDGLSSTELYAEQYVVWHLSHAPGVSQKTVLTSVDRIGF